MFDVKESDFFDLEDAAFDTIIEPGIKFTGNIKFVKPFMIRGKVNGKIDATSDLVIDSCAEVNADINSVRVLVKGTVHGNVTAKQLIFVSASGVLDGDITAAQVVLEPGSTFTGKCTMVRENE
ncbi:MAG: polymer-forming cytoskeletal protein [Treponema sp.]|nr:polymer-forming cytoskeletal protein [Treponema sp.]